MDHEVMLQHVLMSFGIMNVALRWFQSYLLGRSQYVRCGDARSTVVTLMCGVLQGSVLGPILFYHVHRSLGLGDWKSWLVATQTHSRYSGLRFLPQLTTFRRRSPSVSAVSSWMKSNRLSLNCDGRRQHQLPSNALDRRHSWRLKTFLFRRYFDAVGWVFWPVKLSPG